MPVVKPANLLRHAVRRALLSERQVGDRYRETAADQVAH
jgi:hypothetical protein